MPPIIVPLIGASFFAALIGWGLYSGDMPSGLGFVTRSKSPIAFSATAFLWGVCCLIFVVVALLSLQGI